MKKIKVYSIRKTIKYRLQVKVAILTTSFLLGFFTLNLFQNTSYLTDILQNNKISSKELTNKAKMITFDGTIWPVKQVTDFNYKHISSLGITYEDLRKKTWDDVPLTLKTDFPTKWVDYMRKYQNITLKTCWDIFTDPDKLADFTFRRRVVRATWTASYDSGKIWKKNTGTHAGVDIILNTGTPIYSIANGLVTQIKSSNKGYGKVVIVLSKVNGKYYLIFYGHLNSINSNLKVGDFIKKGDLIGKSGNSGNSHGPHLHLQINKVNDLSDILNGKATKGYFKSSEEVRKYTIDPISFIENNYKSFIETKQGILDNTISKKVKTPVEKIVVEKIKPEITYTNVVSSVKNQDIAYIKGVKLNLMGNKIQLGKGFSITINLNPGKGKITIIPSNSNLSFYPDKIIDPNKNSYIINFLAIKEGKTILRILDGKSERSYTIDIYKPEDEKIYGVGVNVDSNLKLISSTKLELYPTDKFAKRLNLPLKGKFDIFVEKNGNKKLVKTVDLGKDNIVYIKGKFIGKGKLVVKSDKYYTKINVITDIAKDYPYNAKFADSISSLIANNIIKGSQGKIYPNRNLTRRELITILGRSILKTDYEKAKIDMQNYIKTKGRFFKDISGKLYSDPYIYDAWKKQIIKGENNYSLASKNITKAELLTILTRIFKVPVQEDVLNVWNDLKGGDLKKVADTVKKYNLYPFTDYHYFNAGKFVTREKTFESLKRFIDFNSDSVDLHTSAIVPSKGDGNLEGAIKEIFDF